MRLAVWHMPLQGTVVVTGGLGMIGSLVGAWLAKQGVHRIVLLGRSGKPGSDSGAVTSLIANGCDSVVAMIKCDAASSEEVQSVAQEAVVGRLQVSLKRMPPALQNILFPGCHTPNNAR